MASRLEEDASVARTSGTGDWKASGVRNTSKENSTVLFLRFPRRVTKTNLLRSGENSTTLSWDTRSPEVRLYPICVISMASATVTGDFAADLSALSLLAVCAAVASIPTNQGAPARQIKTTRDARLAIFSGPGPEILFLAFGPLPSTDSLKTGISAQAGSSVVRRSDRAG